MKMCRLWRWVRFPAGARTFRALCSLGKDYNIAYPRCQCSLQHNRACGSLFNCSASAVGLLCPLSEEKMYWLSQSGARLVSVVRISEVKGVRFSEVSNVLAL